MSQQFHELLIELDAVEVHQAAIFSHVRNKKFFLLFLTFFVLIGTHIMSINEIDCHISWIESQLRLNQNFSSLGDSLSDF